MTADLLVVLALMLLNGVFAGSEIAVLTVRKTRLAELLEEKRKGAAAVQWLRKQPERFLATVQIGITVVGTTAAAYGGERIAHSIGDSLRGVPVIGSWASKVGLVLVIVGISVLEIVVGELIPKSIALRSAERYALTLGPFLRLMASVLRPVVWTLSGLSNGVLKLFGDKTSFSETRLSPEELQELVEEAARTGSLDSTASEIASRAIEFRELRATDVMVRRARIVSIAKDSDASAVRKAFEQRHHSRLLVYEGISDNIVGYVALKDLYAQSLSGDGFSLASVMRGVQFVPSSLSSMQLLRQMQLEHIPLAVVVDETGGVVGLVTIEDLLEEIVGDLSSEQDARSPQLALDAERSVELLGELQIRDVNRQLDLSLQEPDEYSTIAGLCIDLAGHIPAQGEVLTLADGSTITILEASSRRVRKVRLTLAKAPTPGADED